MKRLNWRFLTVFGSFHLVALFGIWCFSWRALGLAFLGQIAFGWLGVGVGYHRLLAHRGYVVPKWLEYVFATLGALAIQGGPISWVRTHKQHHADSDGPKDPHSPVQKGFWHAHLGWMVRGGQDEIGWIKGPTISTNRYYRFLEIGQIAFQIPLGLLLYWWGGWQFVIYGIFVRQVISWHATFFVNSATHVWGYRNFRTKDNSRNSWWVSLLTGGEGWHNNHHHAPRAATTRVRWWEIDFNWYPIWFLMKIRLAKAVVVARRAVGQDSKLAS